MANKKKQDDENKTDDKTAEQSETKQAEAEQGTIADQKAEGHAPQVNRNYQGETDTNAGI